MGKKYICVEEYIDRQRAYPKDTKTTLKYVFASLREADPADVIPADYIREQKIVYAKQMLLNSDYSVMQIADMLSFSSQSHFVQVFKNMVGLTPKKFREQKPEFLKNKKGTGYEKKD